MADFVTPGGTNPYDSKVYADRAVKKEQEGKYDEAIKEYNQNAGVYYGRGNCKYNLKDFTGAIEDYTKVLKRLMKYWLNSINLPMLKGNDSFSY